MYSNSKVIYRYLLRNNADVVSFKGILIMFASRCGETASLGSSKSSGTIEVERSMEEPPFDEDLRREYLFSKGTLPSLFDLEKIIYIFIKVIEMF